MKAYNEVINCIKVAITVENFSAEDLKFLCQYEWIDRCYLNEEDKTQLKLKWLDGGLYVVRIPDKEIEPISMLHRIRSQNTVLNTHTWKILNRTTF